MFVKKGLFKVRWMGTDTETQNKSDLRDERR